MLGDDLRRRRRARTGRVLPGSPLRFAVHHRHLLDRPRAVARWHAVLSLSRRGGRPRRRPRPVQGDGLQERHRRIAPWWRQGRDHRRSTGRQDARRAARLRALRPVARRAIHHGVRRRHVRRRYGRRCRDVRLRDRSQFDRRRRRRFRCADGVRRVPGNAGGGIVPLGQRPRRTADRRHRRRQGRTPAHRAGGGGRGDDRRH